MHTIIISRTDKIGDVILTLPLAALLKKEFPNARIIFLGNSYTKPIISCCSFVDEVIEWDTISKLPHKKIVEQFKQMQATAIFHVFPNKHIAQISFKAGIQMRVGTSHRSYHWLYCNKLLHFGRKKSMLHEAQLNLNFLKALQKFERYSIEQLSKISLFSKLPSAESNTLHFIDKTKKTLILHPHSMGSAREWPLDSFVKLCNLLPEEKYHLLFCGTEKEAALYRPFLGKINRDFADAGGKLSLEQYIALISESFGLVAASTGPLHIAAACGVHAFGIYPPIVPMHPGRWAPLGKKVHVFVHNENCSLCRKLRNCECMNKIKPEDVFRLIESLE
jgi:heptosyltransferase III